ncbi:hypothetical protein H1C71_011623 [Ictidomys tridecemlineatus]|nr:hypothetical protein H1C71_011623 [Ictidomys tridecemlineatus]
MRMATATLMAGIGVPLRVELGPRSSHLGPVSRPHPILQGLGFPELGPCIPQPLLRPELSHRCPATILGWPQTRTRIAFGQSVAKPQSSRPRSPAGFRFALF